jgi:hypothetical protein
MEYPRQECGASVQRIVNNDPTPLLVSTVCRDALKETRSIERKYLLTALVELDQGTPAEIGAQIQARVTGEDRQQWQQGTPADWAKESAGNSQDASLSAACIWRDHRKLRRVGTRCDTDSLKLSRSEAGVDAEETLR